MKSNIAKRIRNRVRDEIWKLRVRSGTVISGGTNFDYWARWSDKAHASLRDVPVSEEFIARGVRQLEFLKSHGLKPDSFVLDYGCSILRTATFLVPLLNAGRYVGVDVGAQAMRRGVLRLQGKGIDRFRYHLVTVQGPELCELDGFRFDFIFSDSVLQYLNDSDFLMVMQAFRRLVAVGGVVYASFPDESACAALEKKGNYFRTRERMYEICVAAGFNAEILDADKSGYPASPYVLLRTDA